MACRVIISRKTGSPGCVRDIGASSGDVGRKLRVQRVKGAGGEYWRQIGFKVTVIITIQETFSWMCCNLNDMKRGCNMRKPNMIIYLIYIIKVTVTITIQETFSWMCSYHNDMKNGV